MLTHVLASEIKPRRSTSPRWYSAWNASTTGYSLNGSRTLQVTKPIPAFYLAGHRAPTTKIAATKAYQVCKAAKRSGKSTERASNLVRVSGVPQQSQIMANGLKDAFSNFVLRTPVSTH